MTGKGPDETKEGTAPIRTAHYMIRVQQLGEDPSAISGVVERLGAGEKRRFDTGEHLIRLIQAWPDDPPNMQDLGGVGKPAEPVSE